MSKTNKKKPHQNSQKLKVTSDFLYVRPKPKVMHSGKAGTRLFSAFLFKKKKIQFSRTELLTLNSNAAAL